MRSPKRYRALVVASAGLGLRQGEACALTVDRVDFLRRKVTVDRAGGHAGEGERLPLRADEDAKLEPGAALTLDRRRGTGGAHRRVHAEGGDPGR
jgi:hypothetical protein